MAVRILAGAAALVAVLVIGAAIAVATLDVNTLIGPVTERVRAATGRELAVHGGARIAVSLVPRLVLRDVTLSNAPWAAGKDMVTAKELVLRVALLPLLARRFELVELTLVAPSVSLETDAQGRHNWDFQPAAPAAGGTPAGTVSLPPALASGNVGIVDGTITLRDGASGAVTRIEVGNFEVHARDPQSPFTAQFRGKVDDVPVAVEGTFGPMADLVARRWPYAVTLQGEVAGQKTAISAKVRAVDREYALDDLAVKLGANALTGSFAVTTGGARPRVAFDLTAPALALAALPIPVAAPAAGTAAPAPASRAWLIPDTPVDFAPLRLVDAQGALAVGTLTLADGRRFDDLRVALTLAGGRLDVSRLHVAALGGTVQGSLAIDASKAGQATLHVKLDGRNVAAGALLAAVGQPRDVQGGKTDVGVDLALRGNSPHAWAASATGSVRVTTGHATLVNARSDPASALVKLASAVNPFRDRDPSTDLRCFVARLPLHDGVARVERGIAAETDKVGVSASGTLDFRNETLDLRFQPKVRKGIPIDVAGLADLVGVSGPFASPQVHIDPVGSAKAIASIGAAVSTGGLSAVGQALFAWAENSGPGPCALAEGAAPAPAKPAAGAAPASSNPAGELGKALGKLFGR